MLSGLSKLCNLNVCNVNFRNISTSNVFNRSRFGTIWMNSRLRVVDNSEIGKEAAMINKPVKVIRVYNKANRGCTGDKVLVAIRGTMKKGYLVGLKQFEPGFPRFDSNNVVLVNDDGSPIGSRILVPIPSKLRGQSGDISKIFAIATKFV